MSTITEELRKEIAQYFISDSKEFLFRFDQIQGFQTQISNRSKLMIDLIFSVECSLKALIFLESNEDERVTYKNIIIHDLKKLMNLVVDRSGLQNLESLLSEDIEMYNVSSRYTLEANINFRENNSLGKKYYDTIANPVWLDKFYKIAHEVLKFVESKIYSFEFKTINFSDIDLDREIEKGNRINNISKK